MAQYVGYSSINACRPKTTNAIPGSAGGTGGTVGPGGNGGTGGVGGPGGGQIGISSGNKYTITDNPLVLQDFINSMNIRKGSKVGRPDYGSDIWNYIFEYNTSDTQFRIENEVRRLASQDPRIILNYVKSYPYENGILVEVEIAVNPFNQPQTVNIGFNTTLNVATLL
jgi:phage baseplate assembly protein W